MRFIVPAMVLLVLLASCPTGSADRPAAKAAMKAGAEAAADFQAVVRPGFRLTVEKSGGLSKPEIMVICEGGDFKGSGQTADILFYRGGQSSIGVAGSAPYGGKAPRLASKTDVVPQLDALHHEKGKGEKFVEGNGLVTLTLVLTLNKGEDGQPLAEPMSFPVATIVFPIRPDGRWTNSPVEQKWAAN
jgi:hypothetical protein